MNIRKIYRLNKVDTEKLWPLAEWCDHDAFFHFVGGEVNDERFNFTDASDDERVEIELKACADASHDHFTKTLEYIAIKFDGSYVGLAVCLDTNFGYTLEDRYITNYPKYQAMIAYVNAMYVQKPKCVIGETTDIIDLDGRYGHVIDKRYSFNTRKEGE